MEKKTHFVLCSSSNKYLVSIVPSIVLDIRDKEEERNAHKWYGGNTRSKENNVSQVVQREWGSYNNGFLEKVRFKLRADWSVQVSYIMRREENIQIGEKTCKDQKSRENMAYSVNFKKSI